MLALALLLAAQHLAPFPAPISSASCHENEQVTLAYEVDAATFWASADTVDMVDTLTLDVGSNDVIWYARGSLDDKVALYDVESDTLTIYDGYSCLDIARVTANRPTKRNDTLMTVWNGTGATGCTIDDDGVLSCHTTSFTFDGGSDTGVYQSDDGRYSVAVNGEAVVAVDPMSIAVLWVPPFGPAVTVPMIDVTAHSMFAWGYGFMLLFLVLRFRAMSMAETPAPSAPAPAPDGLLDEFMSRVFGRSWRTGISGFAGVALTVVAAVASVEPPYNFQKLAPLMPGLVASLGLLVAKDGKVSHTQAAPK